jgi:two-component system NtrC family sensor kinase
MKIFKTITLFILLPFIMYGQNKNPLLTDLYKSLSEAASDTARMEYYGKLGSYYSVENRDSSNFYLEKALAIASSLALRFDEATILNDMGIIQMQQEKFSKALELYLKALNIARDPRIEKTIRSLAPGQTPTRARMLLLSDCYDLIGLLNAYTGNWMVNTKNQLKNYREAEKYAKAAEDQRQIAYVNFHMGIAYMNDGNQDSAIYLLNYAISTFTGIKDLLGLGRAMKYLGDTYQKLGKLDLAANTILKSIETLKQTNDRLHLGLAYNSLSLVYTDLKKNDSALYYARESLKIFEKRKDLAWKRDAYNLLTACFDRMGNTDSAIAYLKLSKTLSDSLSVEERKNLLAFLDVVVDEQVKLEKLEKEKIETREKLRTYLLLSGIAVFIIIVFLLYRNNQHRKKTNETLRARNEKIESTLQQLISTQTQLVQSEKMASLGQLTAGIAHEIQNPLNFVNNFSEVNKELLVELNEEIDKQNYQAVKTIIADIILNEDKISHHGKRADSIVKGMLQHSSATTGIRESTAINKLVEEYTKLAFHGFRGRDSSFDVNLQTVFDPAIDELIIAPQDIGRVLLNVLNNAFYAVNQIRRNDPGFSPELIVETKKISAGVEIKITDNGGGIPQNILDKIFQPFFTTKPTGQGTGLGLSLAYDIVKAHGGELKVEAEESKGSSFIIVIPNHSA